jgi:hypothetical protein
MTPDAAAAPSQPPATHLSASHSINQIKSNYTPKTRNLHCANDAATILHFFAGPTRT